MRIKDVIECQEMLAEGIISQFSVYAGGYWHLGISAPKRINKSTSKKRNDTEDDTNV